MSDSDRLILVFGPKDENGLRQYFLYCRSCHEVSVYAPPGCLSLLLLRFHEYTPVRIVPPSYVLDHFKHGMVDTTSLRYAPKILTAMREDGVLDA